MELFPAAEVQKRHRETESGKPSRGTTVMSPSPFAIVTTSKPGREAPYKACFAS